MKKTLKIELNEIFSCVALKKNQFLKDVLEKLNNKMVAREDQSPTKELIISDCGLTKHNPYTLDAEKRN